MGYLAARHRAHPPRAPGSTTSRPRVNHPVRNAERAAMLDHVTDGASSGAPAGARAATRSPRSTSSTRTPPRPSGKRSSARSRACGSSATTRSQGEHFTVPDAPQRPAQALRRRAPADLGGVRQPGHVRPGRRAGHRRHRLQLRARSTRCRAASTPTRRRIAGCTEPLGQFKNDNVMMTNAVICLADRKRAREIAMTARPRLPLLAGVPVPRHDAEARLRARCGPQPPLEPPTEDDARRAHRARAGCCAARPTRCAEQVEAYQTSAATRSCSACPTTAWSTRRCWRCSSCSAPRSSPQFDTDPVHSTTRYRETARAQVPRLRPPGSRRHASRCCRPTRARSVSARSRRCPATPRETRERAGPRGRAPVRRAGRVPGDGPRRSSTPPASATTRR